MLPSIDATFISRVTLNFSQPPLCISAEAQSPQLLQKMNQNKNGGKSVTHFFQFKGNFWQFFIILLQEIPILDFQKGFRQEKMLKKDAFLPKIMILKSWVQRRSIFYTFAACRRLPIRPRFSLSIYSKNSYFLWYLEFLIQLSHDFPWSQKLS